MDNQMIDYRKGMDVGLGYNLLTGTTGRSPVVTGDVGAIDDSHGQHVDTKFQITTDVTKLHESLGINVEAEGSYMGFSASAKLDYANSCDFSSFSTYAVIRVRVSNAFVKVKDPKFSTNAWDLLEANNKTRFRERYGDCFISGRQSGGEYFAIYQFTSTSETQKSSLAAEVNAAWIGVVASAELHAKIQTAKESTREHVETHVYTYRDGSIREADLTLEDIIETARQFPVEVGSGEAVTYAVMLDDYKVLNNPGDKLTLFDIQARQEVLAQITKKLLQYKALRDDMSFILANFEDFMNADGSPVDRVALGDQLDEVTAAINAMTDQASACSKDGTKCKFPSYDVGKYQLPTLRQRASGIPVVSLVGLRASAIEHALEDTLRTYEDYKAQVLTDVEPGDTGVVADKIQYGFIISGVKFAFDPTFGAAHHYLGYRRWVVGQDPANGEVGTGSEILVHLKGGQVFPGLS
jgi:hypothetical protein